MRRDDSLLQIECFQIRRLLAHKGRDERYREIRTFQTNDEIAIKRAISKPFFQSNCTRYLHNNGSNQREREGLKHCYDKCRLIGPRAKINTVTVPICVSLKRFCYVVHAQFPSICTHITHLQSLTFFSKVSIFIMFRFSDFILMAMNMSSALK